MKSLQFCVVLYRRLASAIHKILTFDTRKNKTFYNVLFQILYEIYKKNSCVLNSIIKHVNLSIDI